MLRSASARAARVFDVIDRADEEKGRRLEREKPKRSLSLD